MKICQFCHVVSKLMHTPVDPLLSAKKIATMPQSGRIAGLQLHQELPETEN